MTVRLADNTLEELERTLDKKQFDRWFQWELESLEAATGVVLYSFGEEEYGNCIVLTGTEAQSEEEQLAGSYFPCIITPTSMPFLTPNNVAVGSVVVGNKFVFNNAAAIIGNIGVDWRFPSQCVSKPQDAIDISLKGNLFGGYAVNLWEAPRTAGFIKIISENVEETVEKILSQLHVPHTMDRGVLPLLNRATLEAVRLVTSIIAEEISAGLAVKHVNIEPLMDCDAGQWSEVVFSIQVNLKSASANREWDRILAKILEVAGIQTDTKVATSLLERIGVHFTWVESSSV